MGFRQVLVSARLVTVAVCHAGSPLPSVHVEGLELYDLRRTCANCHLTFLKSGGY